MHSQNLTYKNYTIETIFDYKNGTFDFQYQNNDDSEDSGLGVRTTLKAVKEDIDERILEKEMIWI